MTLDLGQISFETLQIVTGFYYSSMMNAQNEPFMSSNCVKAGVELTDLQAANLDLSFSI